MASSDPSGTSGSGQGEGYSQGATGSSGLQPGQTPTPAQLRQYAKEQGWSEDFDRYPDETLQRWLKYWNPHQMRFNSMRGANGTFEKPQECPEGTSPGGPNETDPCVKGGTGGGGDSASATATPAASTQGTQGQLAYTGNPLTDMLIYQFNNTGALGNQGQQNIFGMTGGREGQAAPTTPVSNTAQELKGGGLWWAPTDQATKVFGWMKPPAAPAAKSAPAPTISTNESTTPTPDASGQTLSTPTGPVTGGKWTDIQNTPMNQMLRRQWGGAVANNGGNGMNMFY